MIDRCIGIVDSVSASEIKGYLLDSAPKSVAFSYGGMSLFPRINGFLIIPNETGCLVGIINWIGYNHLKDENDVKLPKGSRMIALSIIGHLVNNINDQEFERGTFSLPTVGDQILLPSEEQLNAIVKNTSEGCIEIGTSPLTGNQPVKIPVNELFGKHIAVLGNTGSGKSCTVSGLVRWSIEAAKKQIGKSPNVRFIVLDPNGEYKNVFNDLDIEVMNCSVKAMEDGDVSQLHVPAWMWTSEEWASIIQASDKTQKPLLREALRTLRSSEMINSAGKNVEKRAIQVLSYIWSYLKVICSTQDYLKRDGRGDFGRQLKERNESLKIIINGLDSENEVRAEVEPICMVVDQMLGNALKSFTKDNQLIEYYDYCRAEDVNQIREQVETVILKYKPLDDINSVSEDDPIEFRISALPQYLEDIAANSSAAQYIDFMTVRIKSMLNNAIVSPVIGNDEQVSLLTWINGFLGGKEDDKGKICVIDLSILPSDIVHLIVATISRLIFESLQRYRKYYGKELPTVMVMEEAHSFIHKTSDEESGANKLCTRVFERIAREGRKYGLGLIVSSQRPAELSETVLSQCNSFILHRIVNDRDQAMVKKLVPDNIGSLLNELPSLPTKKAIVLGSAVQIPILVDVNEIPRLKRPQSDTPDYWGVWTGNTSVETNWEPIVNIWQKNDYDD